MQQKCPSKLIATPLDMRSLMFSSATRSLVRRATTPWPPRAARSQQLLTGLAPVASASKQHVPVAVKAHPLPLSHQPRVPLLYQSWKTAQPCLLWKWCATRFSATWMAPPCIWTCQSPFSPIKSPLLPLRSRKRGRTSQTSVGSLQSSIWASTKTCASRKMTWLQAALESFQRCVTTMVSPM